MLHGFSYNSYSTHVSIIFMIHTSFISLCLHASSFAWWLESVWLQVIIPLYKRNLRPGPRDQPWVCNLLIEFLGSFRPGTCLITLSVNSFYCLSEMKINWLPCSLLQWVLILSASFYSQSPYKSEEYTGVNDLWLRLFRPPWLIQAGESKMWHGRLLVRALGLWTVIPLVFKKRTYMYTYVLV